MPLGEAPEVREKPFGKDEVLFYRVPSRRLCAEGFQAFVEAWNEASIKKDAASGLALHRVYDKYRAEMIALVDRHTDAGVERYAGEELRALLTEGQDEAAEAAVGELCGIYFFRPHLISGKDDGAGDGSVGSDARPEGSIG